MLSETVERTNAWIAAENVCVLKVETVVLPNVEDESSASEVGTRTNGELGSYWYEVDLA